MGAIVQVFQRQQMPVLNQHLPVGIEQVPREAARLGASATVGTAVTDILAQIALPAMADAKRAMHEKLKRDSRFFTDLTNLLQAQLTT